MKTRFVHGWPVRLVVGLAAWISLVRSFSAEPRMDLLISNLPPKAVFASASGESGAAEMSSDGRFMLFLSTADDLVNQCRNGAVMDLFRLDIRDRSISLVSASIDRRNGGNQDTHQGVISSDGRFVAFESSASNLTEDDESGVSSVFLRDMELGVTRLLRMPTFRGGTQTPERIAESTMAMDAGGRRMAWVKGGMVYAYDAVSNATILVTRSVQLTPPVRFPRSWSLGFCADGSRLVFASTAGALVGTSPARSVPLSAYIYRFDPGSRTNMSQLRLTPRSVPTVQSGFETLGVCISEDGQFVTAGLTSLSFAGVPGVHGVFQFEEATGESTELTAGLSLRRGASMNFVASKDHSKVAFQINQAGGTNGLFLWTRDNGAEAIFSGADTSGRSGYGSPIEFSPDGQWLIFESSDTNAVVGGASYAHRYLLYNTADATRAPLFEDAMEARHPSFAGTAPGVVFESASPGLVPGDGNQASDVFMKDDAGVELLSRRNASVAPRTPSHSFSYPDRAPTRASLVAYSWQGNDPAYNDTNNLPDVYVHDHRVGVTRLVSVRSDGAGPGNGPSSQPKVSSDGRYISFVSRASDVVADDDDTRADLFVRDTSQSVTRLVSLPRILEGGIPEVASVGEVAMDASGSNFVWVEVTDKGREVRFRSMDTNVVVELDSTAPARCPTISQDGSVLAYCLGELVGTRRVRDARTVLAPSLPVGIGPVRLLLNANGSQLIVMRSRRAPWILDMTPTVPGTSPNPYHWVENIVCTNAYLWTLDGELSSDDKFLVFSGVLASAGTASRIRSGIHLLELATGRAVEVGLPAFGDQSNGDARHPRFSPDARWITFDSTSSNLVSDDDNSASDVFLLDRISGRTRMLSRTADFGSPMFGNSFSGQFAGTNQITFRSSSLEVVAPDLNDTADVFRLTLPEDSDGDGMADNIELAAFGTLENSYLKDVDGDGVPNGFEIAAGTKPNDPESRLRVTLGADPDTGWMLSWQALEGRRYRVMEGRLGKDGFTWTPLGKVVSAQGTRVERSTILPGNDTEARYFTLQVAE